MSSISRQQLEKYLNSIEITNSKVLDIGGSQLPIKNRIKYLNCTFDILDLEQPHESKVKPDIIGDIQNGFDFVKNPKLYDYSGFISYYDIAFCIEVSEYWWNPFDALRTIYKLLRSGGTLYISFHFSYGIHNPVGLDYLRYTPDGAIKILNECGFEILDIEYRKATPELLEYYKSEGQRIRRDMKHDFSGFIIKAKKI